MNVFVLRNALHDSVKRISVLAALIATSALGAQAQVVYSPAMKVSHDIDSPGEPQVAVDSAGNINLVWSEQTTPCTSASCIVTVFFSRSTDGGATFSTPLNISNGSDGSSLPQIALGPGGNIYVIWNNPSGVFFSRSADSGATFSTPLNTSGSDIGELSNERPNLAVDTSGSINIVWGNQAGNVWFTRSTDGGTTFSTPAALAINAFSPSMVADSAGNINILWESSVAGHNPYDVFFTRSTDGGTTFSAPKDVTSNPDGSWYEQVAVAPDGTINVVWNSNCQNTYFSTCPGGPSSAVFFAQSKDNGATFSAPVNLSNTSNVSIRDVRMALDAKGNIEVVWPEAVSSGSSGFFSHSTDGGASFSTPQQIVNGFPNRLAVDASGNIDVVASTSSGVSVVRSTDGGSTFSTTNVSSSAASPMAVEMMIAADAGGNVSVAWPNYDFNTSKWDVFFSRGTIISLSALGLGPADVTGGSSSTGTVTMNGSAPTGGTVISLSSSDPSVSVPATVTIAEGTTSTTFTVATTPVAARTGAVITAAFGGATQTASITEEPPALASVTLNPSSVTGRSSSTGAVTLNGPAPAGGTVVALSSSNSSVATVPSSVTVPAGFTNTTFRVNTGLALCPNSATITGSFSGVSRTANLAVMPFVSLPSRACSGLGGHGRAPNGRQP